MKKSVFTAVAAMLLLSIFGGRPMATLNFPILVFGPDGYTTSVSLSATDGPAADSLQMKLHGLNYDGIDNSGDSKGRFRVNSGSWIEISNATATCVRQYDRDIGCLTVVPVPEIRIPVTGVVTGTNTIEFQFRADSTVAYSTEGHGYRILDLAWVENDGTLQRDYTRTDTDPSTWTSSGDVAAGRAFFADSVVTGKGMGSETTCSSCHLQKGSEQKWPGVDLALFNYEPEVIRQVVLDRREADSSETWMQTNADNVVAWVLSLRDSLDNAGGWTSEFSSAGYDNDDLFRPWSLLYQGCPASVIKTDTMALEFFAASGGKYTDWGYDCLVEDDGDMQESMFADYGYITWKSKSLHPDSVSNHREIGTPIQTPPWNQWLTRDDPYAIWDGDSGRLDFDTAAGFEDYWETTIPATITAENWSQLATDIDNFWSEGNDFEDLNPYDTGNFNSSIVSSDRAKLIRMQWQTSRLFEFMFFDHVEDKVDDAYAGDPNHPTPYERGWFGDRARSMFDLAPHILAGGGKTDIYGADGSFRDRYNDTWPYELQCTILNTGSGNGAFFRPCDLKYTYGHINDMQKNTPGMRVGYRNARVYATAMQNGSNDGASTDWMVRHVQLSRIFNSIGGQKWPYNNMPTTERKNLIQALIRAHFSFVKQYTTEWPCGTAIDQYECSGELVSKGSTISSGEFAGLPDGFDQNDAAQSTYRALFIMDYLGIDATLIDTVAHWGDDMGWEPDTGELPWSNWFLSGSAPASSPSLASPSNGATDQAVESSISWASVADATEYDYQIDDDSDFSSPAESGTTSSLSASYTLLYETEYYWRVRATNSYGDGDWSSSWSFTTEEQDVVITDKDYASGGSRDEISGTRFSITGQGVLGTIAGNATLDGFLAYQDMGVSDTMVVKLDSLRGSSSSIYKTFSLIALADADSSEQFISVELAKNRVRLVSRETTGSQAVYRETHSTLPGDADDICFRIVRSTTSFTGAWKEGGSCTTDSGWLTFTAGTRTLSSATGTIKGGVFASGATSGGSETSKAYLKDWSVY